MKIDIKTSIETNTNEKSTFISEDARVKRGERESRLIKVFRQPSYKPMTKPALEKVVEVTAFNMKQWMKFLRRYHANVFYVH